MIDSQLRSTCSRYANKVNNYLLISTTSKERGEEQGMEEFCSKHIVEVWLAVHEITVIM